MKHIDFVSIQAEARQLRAAALAGIVKGVKSYIAKLIVPSNLGSRNPI